MTGEPQDTEAPIELEGRAVLLTGGAGGLGHAMARALVASGARVALVDVDAAGLDEIVGDLGPTAFGIVADISCEEGVHRAVVMAGERLGAVEVLVNNAGIGPSEVRAGDRYSKPIHLFEVTPVHLRRFFEVHVLGPFLLTQALAPAMVEQCFGRIVTVTTSLSNMLRAGNAPYGPVKAASEAFTSIAAGDLAAAGVTANVLVPGGAADTKMVPILPDRPRDVLVRPEVMGPPMVWLASDESSEVTARRFVARQWNSALPRSAAAALASYPIGWSGGS